MGNVNKVLALILSFIIVTSSQLLPPLVNAQSIPNLSVPEVKVEYKQYNPIILTIKNQLNDSHIDEYGDFVGLHYTVRYKEYSEEEWKYYPVNTSTVYFNQPVYPASNSTCTIINLPLSLFENYKPQPLPNSTVLKFPIIGFQVKALYGSTYVVHDSNKTYYSFIGLDSDVSDWSSILGMSVPENITATEPPRNPSHLELLDYLLPISVILVAITIIIISVLFFRRHRKTANVNN